MTEKVEDFAPPKYRQAHPQREGLPPAPEPPKQRLNQEQEDQLVRTVESAITEAKQIQNDKVQDFAQLGAQAILKYAEASARRIEEAGDEIIAEAEAAKTECYQLAEDIRHAARVQAAAVERAMGRNKEAAHGATALRKAFHDSVSKERAELEATKQRAVG